MGKWGTFAAALIPSLGLALVFWYAMRAILRADRNERAAQAKLDEEEGLPKPSR